MPVSEKGFAIAIKWRALYDSIFFMLCCVHYPLSTDETTTAVYRTVVRLSPGSFACPSIHFACSLSQCRRVPLVLPFGDQERVTILSHGSSSSVPLLFLSPVVHLAMRLSLTTTPVQSRHTLLPSIFSRDCAPRPCFRVPLLVVRKLSYFSTYFLVLLCDYSLSSPP